MTTNILIRLSNPLSHPRAMLKNLRAELNHALHYHLINPYKRITTFIPKAIEWVKILWDAGTVIEGFCEDGQEMIEGCLLKYEDDPRATPYLIAAINHLQPEILSTWLDEYEPSLNGTYVHPELVDEFVETYGRFIRRSTQPEKQRLSSTPGPEGREQSL
jgi:hypothetical protein